MINIELTEEELQHFATIGVESTLSASINPETIEENHLNSMILLKDKLLKEIGKNQEMSKKIFSLESYSADLVDQIEYLQGRLTTECKND